jgi:hypothetical protein
MRVSPEDKIVKTIFKIAELLKIIEEVVGKLFPQDKSVKVNMFAKPKAKAKAKRKAKAKKNG